MGKTRAIIHFEWDFRILHEIDLIQRYIGVTPMFTPHIWNPFFPGTYDP